MNRVLQRAAGAALLSSVPQRGSRTASVAAGPWAASGSLLRAPCESGTGEQSHRYGALLAAAAAATAAAATLAGSNGHSGRAASAQCEGPSRPVLVVGSLNADIILEIDRLPRRGETLGARKPDTGYMVPGGKGANQAVATARLSAGTGRRAQFVCQLGNDSHAGTLEKVLLDNGLDISACGRADSPSGQAFIFLEADGSNSILIVGGSNVAWPGAAKDQPGLHLIQGASALMLQKEIPEHVNEAMAEAAAKAGVAVVQDVGGEDRPFSDKLLKNLTYICPNETELERLTGMPTATEEQVVAAAKALKKKGVKNVLVTLGADGALLLSESGHVYRQSNFAVPGGKVVDTTGAGDCFRAAFTLALVEGRPPQECLKFAAAAGAITVSRMGAIPSLPTRQEVESLVQRGKL